MIFILQQIIKKSPGICEKSIRYIYYSIPDYIRYGKAFREFYSFLQKSQYWDKKQLEEYQIGQLQKLIKHAYETVPYYKKVFDEYRIQPKEIQDFSDLKRIPYLTKEIIQNNLNDLISNKYNKQNLKYVTTGGSTGIPMGFYVDSKYDRFREWAFISNMWGRIGYDVRKINRCVILRDDIPNKGIHEYKNRDLILSSFKLTKENIEKYISLIEEFNPDFIQAFPSSISILSNYINENNKKIQLKNLKSIICTSENIHELSRKDIESAFGVRIYSFYGHTEHACIGGECEKSNYYHMQSEYGYMELLDENEDEVIDEGGIGEIVATGFNNYVMPFIRYRTCDMAVNTNETCKCGRNYKLIKRIDGRKQEFFVDDRCNKVTFTSSDDALWKVKNKIWAYQYIQHEPGKVILNIQWDKQYNSDDIEIIQRDFKIFYPSLNIQIRNVENIERTKRGKFKYLIQNIGK